MWHAHSLNFVPDARRVFREVARVLRPGGRYRMTCTTPFLHSVWEDDWTGDGYALRDPYADGAEVIDDDPYWTFDPGDGSTAHVLGAREFRHALSTLANGMIEAGFELLGIWEDASGDIDAEPGTWPHFTAVAPPWLIFWAERGASAGG